MSGCLARGPRRWGGAMVVWMVSVTSAQAQGTSPNCTVTLSFPGSATDVCRKAADLFAFVVPQIGVALAGGNHVLGEGGTLGGWGKRTISVRGTAVDGRLPGNAVPVTLSRPAAVGDEFGTTRVPVPMASVDAAIGVLTGLPMGVTNVGGVDALIGAIGYARVASGNLAMHPQGTGIALSYGLRVGALQESSFVPGLSVSWLRRKVPTLDLDYTPANDTIVARNMSLTANTLRVVASKRFVLFGVAAGIGRDDIEGTSGVQSVVNEIVAGTSTRAAIGLPSLREKIRRNTAFVNASFGVPIVRVVAEYGRSSAGTLRETLNTFGGRRANDTYAFGSVGLTVRF